MLLTLKVFIHFILTLKCLFAHLTREYFDNNFFNVAMFKIIFFLLSKLVRQFLFVYTHAFRVSLTNDSFFVFNLLSLCFLLGLDLKSKFLVSEVLIFDLLNKFSYGVIKRDTLSLSFLFVFDFDYSFDSSVWCFFWIVQICIHHRLLRDEEFPFIVE